MTEQPTTPASEYDELLTLASEDDASVLSEDDDSPWPDEPPRAAATSRRSRDDLSSVYDRSDAAAPEGRDTFWTKWDVDAEERKIRAGRVGVAAVVGLVVVFGMLSAAQGRSGVAADTATSPTALPEAARKTPVVGQELRRPPARFDTSGLSAVEDEPEALPSPPADYAPEPAPEPVQLVAAPRATAPNSWRTGLQLQVPDEVGDDPDDDAALGITLPEGTEIPAVLAGSISAPDAGLQPDLARVKAVLSEPFLIDGVEIFPAGTVMLGRCEQTTDKRVHLRFHRAILPDERAVAIDAIALDADLTAGLVADKIEKYRKRNLFSRIGRGVIDTTASIATGGRSAGSEVGSGAIGGAADQAREEADRAREPRRRLDVNRGRRLFIALRKDLSL